MRVIGIDPGLANTGWAILDHTDDGPMLMAAGVIRTKPSAKRLRLRAGDVRALRVRTLVEDLRELIASHRPALVSIETSGGFSINARTALDLTAGWAAALAVARCHDLPVIHYTPRDARRALGLLLGASKDDVWGEVSLRLEGGADTVDRIPRSYRDHAADAASLALAAGESDAVMAVVAARRA